MKIVFLNDGAYAYASGAPAAVGGSERDQWLLGTSLAAFGWSVIVGVRDGLEPGDRRSINGVEFVGIDRGQILVSWYRFLSSERPDWWYWECATHLWGPAVEIAKLLSVRTIFALGFDSEAEPRHALVYRQRWWPLYAWGLARTDRIFAQHNGQISKLPSRLQSKASVLPKVCVLPGVIGDEVSIKPHTMRDNYVAWVAMLRQHKRPDLLVEIARKMPDMKFVVCGGPSTCMTPPGYNDQVINDLCELPNVEYLGQVLADKAQQVIAAAAILLSTSDEEGFPNTFVQAWSSGTPIVTLKVDPDRIIERIGLGAVSGTIERAIGDITVLLDSPQRRDEIATRARNFVVENYSAAAVVSLFERALQGFSWTGTVSSYVGVKR
jgi:glycosyltransferase involved in cell wall biosynthesis